jgi:hypothetical protein
MQIDNSRARRRRGFERQYRADTFPCYQDQTTVEFFIGAPVDQLPAAHCEHRLTLRRRGRRGFLARRNQQNGEEGTDILVHQDLRAEQLQYQAQSILVK